ncbi:hypothetical protein FGB62_90g03 [Gracilaria domingensis]|nr:hypothetical protein FGB62_90g03 [Gracilaria domingensis]
MRSRRVRQFEMPFIDFEESRIGRRELKVKARALESGEVAEASLKITYCSALVLRNPEGGTSQIHIIKTPGLQSICLRKYDKHLHPDKDRKEYRYNGSRQHARERK